MVRSPPPTRAQKRLLQTEGRSHATELPTGSSLGPSRPFVIGYPWGLDSAILFQTWISGCLCRPSQGSSASARWPPGFISLTNKRQSQSALHFSQQLPGNQPDQSRVLGFRLPSNEAEEGGSQIPSFTGGEGVGEENSLFVKGSFEKA